MYCMKCGAKLSDREVKCPLCGFDLPKISPLQEKGVYPRKKRPGDREDFKGALLFLTIIYTAVLGGIFLPVFSLEKSVSVPLCALLFFVYIAFLLPRWFIRPNPVIFFPVSMPPLLLFLYGLDFYWGTGWFFPLALPLVTIFTILVEAVITLNRYLLSGRLYIYGGFFIALGVFSVVGEILYRTCFALPLDLTFSLVSLILLFSVGMGLIVIAIIPSFRRYFERRFFV